MAIMASANTIPEIARSEYLPYDRVQGDELLRLVWRLYRSSLSMRAPYENMWKECWDGWEGSLTLADTNEVPTHYFNQIWKLAEQTTARLTEYIPKWLAKPVEQGDEEFSAVTEKYLRWTLKKAKAANPLQEGVRSAQVCGTGIWKTPWNPDAYRGRGNNELWCCDPYRLYFDLTKTRLEEMSFIIQEYFLDVGYVKRRWGVEVAAVPEFSDLEQPTGAISTANRATAFGTAQQPTIYGSPEGEIVTGRARIIECWLRDFALEATGIALPEPQRDKAKYPDWYVVYAAQDQLLPVSRALKDTNGLTRIPYARPPYVTYRPLTAPTQFYGVSPLHPLLDPQRDYNEGREQLREHRRRHTQPWLTVDPRYAFDPEEASNRDNPLQVPPGLIQYLMPPPLGNEVILATNMAAADMEDISGIHDVSRGQRVPQLTAGVAINALQQYADVRTNAQIPILSEALVEIGENMLYNGAKQWGLAGLLRVAGQQGVDVSKIDVRAIEDELDAVLDFDIDVDVANPVTEREQQRSNVVLLAQAGALPPEAVIELLDIPHAQRYIGMIQQARQQSMALQAAQAGAQPGQGGQPPPNPYSDEAIAGAPSPAQLPSELQAALQLVAEHLGPDVAAATFRGIQRERAQALAERRARSAQ